ncbi:MAG: ABC transporter ATP-binding protein [Patescibacteria group bacterium]|nr:ABC transporter ATP-binding protein [Patescibacteria group bacterium]MCL5431585.1 ABC transporter ATP-binding protein [Patescibacteria group bacterium]
MDSIVEVNKLSKKYRLGGQQPYLTLRDTLAELVRHPIIKRDNHEFWALRDVTFRVAPGEVVGIIGRNGAGKSTLLKIISRITCPTAGDVRLQGNVSSLLEVGTGFSPELTGRENIFLNGAILGMSRSEIRRRFDAIVDFAETEKFLDTPVKYYSSGMYMRLAFSVAAHLEPDILLVDEVLAVGDAEFQKKCLGKMEEVRNRQGRTILFVSHNMKTIEQLCSRCLLIDKGKIVMDGDSQKVISHYLNKQKIQSSAMLFPVDKNKIAQITKIAILNSKYQSRSEVPISEDFYINIEMRVNHRVKKALISIYFYSQGDLLLFSTEGDHSGQLLSYPAGKYKTMVRIPAFLFESGNYTIDVAIQNPGVEIIDKVSEIGFEVLNQDNPRSLLINGVAHDKIAVILDYETKKS